MKNYSIKIVWTLVAAMLLLVVANSTYSQIDPKLNHALPLRLIIPEAYSNESYQNDVVIQSGPFDNYNVTPTAGFMETDICVNPNNPLNFVGTDNRLILSGNTWVYYTLDGGITWANTSVGVSAGDPAFSCDAAGNFYLVTLNPNVSGFYVYKSANGGATWSGATNITFGGAGTIDKEWVAADQTTGATQNNVYICFTNFSAGTSVGFYRSTNSGATWSLVSGNLGTSSNNPGPDVAVDRNGKVILAWNSTSGTAVRTSIDGGATFGSEVVASSHSQPGSVNFGRYCLKGDIRVNAMPHIAVDKTTGSHSNYIYDVYPTNPPGPDAADIYCTRSTDGGATWSTGSPVRVNDDATTTDQWMPDVSVDNQGRVWVSWCDSRNDPTNNMLTEQYGAVSTDGGLTFTNFKIGNQNFNPTSVKISQGGGQAQYMGDYQSISGSTITFPFYSGQNNSRQDFTTYLPDYGISFAKAVDSVNQNGSNTNTLNIPMNGPYSGTVTFTQTISPSPSPGTITINYSPNNAPVLTGSPTSLGMTIIASATVPMQMYTVTVTGAETGGPRTHTRTFNVLVGNFTGIQNNSNEAPVSYNLFQNYPNPFNPSTVIYYSVPKQTMVSLKVYDILGREIEKLVDNQLRPAGEYSVTFNANNLPSGVYYYKMQAGEYSDVRKMMLIK